MRQSVGPLTCGFAARAPEAQRPFRVPKKSVHGANSSALEAERGPETALVIKIFLQMIELKGGGGGGAARSMHSTTQHTAAP